MAGATTNSSSNPLLSPEEEASATAISSPADAIGADASPAATSPPPTPRPSPTITAFSLRILLSWLSAGWRMLYSTQRTAGTRGMRSARPRLSPSAMSAIC
ncbi:unnamed protein product [Musa banksii]